MNRIALLLLLLSLSSCTTATKEFHDCYSKMMQEARERNHNSYVFSYQKRYARFVCSHPELWK